MNLGIFHVLPSKNLEEFDKILKYDWVNCFILEGSDLEMLDYGLKRIKENRKKAFIYMNFALSEGQRKVKAHWKEVFQSIYDTCELSGALDALEGWYYDEPFIDSFMEEDFIEITKFGKEVLRKRNFAIYATPEFDKTIVDYLPQFNDRPEINEHNLKYMTDIAYDFYQCDLQKQAKAQESFKKKAGDKLKNLAVWYIPPVGVIIPEWKEEESEEHCLEILELYKDYIKKEENFGGIFLYTWEPIFENGFVHGNGKKYLTPDKNGSVLWEKLYKEVMNIGRNPVY